MSKFYVAKENAELWLMFCNWSGSYLSTFDSSVSCLMHLFFFSEELKGTDLPILHPHPVTKECNNVDGH